MLLSQRVPRTGNGRGRFGRDQQREDQPQQSCLLQTNEREKEGGTVDGVSKAKSKTMQNKQTSVGGGGGKRKEREEEDGGGTIDSELEEKGIPWWSRREIVGAGRPSLSLVVILGTASPKYTARPRRAT